MTAKELYEWAKSQGVEDWEIYYDGSDGFPMMVACETVKDGRMSLITDPIYTMDYGKYFDGVNYRYLSDGKECSADERWKWGDYEGYAWERDDI